MWDKGGTSETKLTTQDLKTYSPSPILQLVVQEEIEKTQKAWAARDGTPFRAPRHIGFLYSLLSPITFISKNNFQVHWIKNGSNLYKSDTLMIQWR